LTERLYYTDSSLLEFEASLYRDLLRDRPQNHFPVPSSPTPSAALEYDFMFQSETRDLLLEQDISCANSTGHIMC
jgi:hypothetical protein